MYPVSFGGFSNRQNRKLESAGISFWTKRAEEKAITTAHKQQAETEFKEYLEKYRNMPLTTLYDEIVSQYKSYMKSPLKLFGHPQARYHSKRINGLTNMLVERLKARKDWPLSELNDLITRINGYTTFYWDGHDYKLQPKHSVYRALKNAKARSVEWERQQKSGDAQKSLTNTSNIKLEGDKSGLSSYDLP